MADGTLSSAGVPVAPSILGFMTLSAAAEAGLRCCPLRCLAAGKAFTQQTYSSVGRSAVVYRHTFVIKAIPPAKTSHHGSDKWPSSLSYCRVDFCLSFVKKMKIPKKCPLQPRRWASAEQPGQEHTSSTGQGMCSSPWLPAAPLFTSVMWPASGLNKNVTAVLKLFSVQLHLPV